MTLPLFANDTVIPWPHSFMTDAPDKLLHTVRAIQADQPTRPPTHLFHETIYTLDEAGRRTQTIRNVYFITDHDALEEYDSTSVRWRPWYQGRPEMRARVIDPEGGVHALQPSAIVETATDDDDNQFSEDRRLQAPLPNVRVGCLIEVEKVIPGLRPVFEAGDAWQDYFTAYPIAQRIVVETPAKMPFSFHLDDSFSTKYKRHKRAGRRIHSWTLTEPPPAIDYTAALRAGGIYSGRLTFATGASWKKVAAAYAAVVDQTATFTAPPFDLEALKVNGDPRSTAVNLLQEIHKRVRYSGLYLGDKDLMPTAPDQVLKRGYGDCKDTAVLLIAMLRALDMQADLALVHNINRKISADTPGIGLFNHAIVAVALPNGERAWLDTTVTLNRDGALPFQLHGSQALIAHPRTRALTQIPPANPADHGMDFHFDFHPTFSGNGRMKVTYSGRGNHEITFRDQYLNYKEGAEAPDTEHARVASADMSQPWSRTTESESWEGLASDFKGAMVSVPLGWSTEEIPDIVQFAADEPKVPVTLVDAGVFRLSYQFHLPSGYQLAQTFAPVTFESEHVVLADERSSENPTHGVLTLTLKPGVMPVEEVEAVNALLTRLSQTNLLLTFKHQGMLLLEEGKVDQAFAILKQEHEQAPSVQTHFRLASAFSRWGMIEPAMEHVEQGVKYDHNALDMIFAIPSMMVNYTGTEVGPGYLRDRALAVLEGEAEAFPDFPMLYFFSAYTRDHGDNGLIIEDQALLEKSAAEYAKANMKVLSKETRAHHVINRLLVGDNATAKTLADTLDSLRRDVFQIVIAAQEQGPEQALVIARRTANPQQRAGRLLQASDILARLRNYPAASATLNAVTLPQSQELLRLRANMLANAKAIDINAFDDSQPFTPVLRLFANKATMATNKPFSDTQIQLPTYQAALPFLEPPYDAILFNMAAKSSDQAAHNQTSIWDLFLGNLAMTYADGLPESDTTSARIVKVLCPAFQVMKPMFYWVVPTKTGYRIAATTSEPNKLGPAFAHALTRRAGAEAAALFDHLLTLTPIQGRPSDSDFVTLWPALRKLEKNPSKAAALLFHYGDSLKTKDVRALEALVDQVEDDAAKASLVYRIALAYTHSPDKQRAADYYRAWYEAAPDADRALNLLTIYDETGQDEAFKQLLDIWLDKKEKPLEFAQQHGTLYEKQGDFDGMARVLTGIREDPIAKGVGIQNSLAWLALFRDDADLDAAIADAENAVATTIPAMGMSGASAATYHTLATLYATQGKNQEAVDTLRKAVVSNHRFTPNGADWYVLGLVAQNLGFNDIARTYYTRVDSDEADPSDTIHLVRRRLAEMDSAVTQGAGDEP